MCSIFLRNNPLFFPGYDIFEKQPVKDSLVSVPDTAAGFGTPPLRLGCFYMLVFVPITCALLQLAAWSRFTLHGRKLQGIKALRQGSRQGHLIDVKAIWTIWRKWPEAAHRHFSNSPPLVKVHFCHCKNFQFGRTRHLLLSHYLTLLRFFSLLWEAKQTC